MERNAYFDNAKFLLIFLVVFGHAIQPFTGDSNSISTLYTWIYTFHMPAFILLAGFFAKGSGNHQFIVKLAKQLLVPYLIFQTIYSAYFYFIGKDNWLTDHIFYPHWSLWFLVSLFCWHLLLIVYKRMPAYISISLAILIGILIGFLDNVEHTFSLSRTFVFFPFFLIGYFLKLEHLNYIKRKGFKIMSAIMMVLIALSIYYLPEINFGWLLASKSYSSLGLEGLGWLARLSIYGTSMLMVTFVLSWIPKRRLMITKLGERTIYIYLLHGFIIQYFRQTNYFEMTSLFDFMRIVLFSGFIVYLLSSRFVVSISQPIIEISTSRLRNHLQWLRQLREH